MYGDSEEMSRTLLDKAQSDLHWNVVQMFQLSHLNITFHFLRLTQVFIKSSKPDEVLLQSRWLKATFDNGAEKLQRGEWNPSHVLGTSLTLFRSKLITKCPS